MLVQASGLVKDYPRIRALDQVSLEIREGEVFGLFGPNGAGKTTCLRVLSGLTRPTGGQATVCGVDVGTQPNEVRKRLGILFDLPTPYEDMTVRVTSCSLRGCPGSRGLRSRSMSLGRCT